MAYTFNKLGNGNVEVLQDGQRVSTGTPDYAKSLGYTDAAPPVTAVQQQQNSSASTSLGAVNNAPAPIPTPYYSTAETLSQSLQGAGANPDQASTIAHAAAVPYDSTYAGGASYTGPSIVDFLSKAGQPTDLTSRTALAAKYGIQGYTGTSAQNTQLLNTLRGAATKVSGTGVPENTGKVLGVSTSMPDPSKPFNLSALGGNTDLAKILSAGVSGGSIPSDIAGLLALYGASSDSEKNYNDVANKALEDMRLLGGKGADEAAALESYGVNDAYKHVQELNLKAAQLKGELEKFDADTLAASSSIEEQAIPTGLISGQKAQLQKQRDLTRIGKAAELSATVALSQAYAGNAELGEELAKKSVDLKYYAQENELKTLQAQLGIAEGQMNREDSKTSKIISTLLSYKEKQLTENKASETKLQTIGVQAASGGAPLSEVNAAMATNDPVQAATLLSKYLKGPTESNSSSSGSLFTQTQVNAGAAHAGLPIADFGSMGEDDKNYFINNYSNFSSALTKLNNGDITEEDLSGAIENSGLSQTAKAILYKQAGIDQGQVLGATSGGDFWSSIGSGLSSALGWLLGGGK